MDIDILEIPIIREAWDRGKVEGERKMALSMLNSRFGPIPQWAIDRIGTASAEELEALVERAFHSNSLDEIF